MRTPTERVPARRLASLSSIPARHVQRRQTVRQPARVVGLAVTPANRGATGTGVCGTAVGERRGEDDRGKREENEGGDGAIPEVLMWGSTSVDRKNEMNKVVGEGVKVQKQLKDIEAEMKERSEVLSCELG